MKLNDSVVKKLAPPDADKKIYYDDALPGFGVRVTAAGTRSFVLNYTTKAGRERRFTIGRFPNWTTVAARMEARQLRRRVDTGEDPQGDLHVLRDAPTVDHLCERFLDEHASKKRPATQREYGDMVRNFIVPALGAKKVVDVSFADIEKLHRSITKRGTPRRANGVAAVSRKMFALAVRWKMRPDNPATGIEFNEEHSRTRYLSSDEIVRLTEALKQHHDQQAANIIRLLLFTGARRGEVLSARWDQFDIQAGTWTKPGATTKQKTAHHVPLSAPALQLLAEMPRSDSAFVFPGRVAGQHRATIKYNWAAICRDAKIEGVRVHDLRHTFASIGVSSGLTLPIIGALLGHSNPATTARYAHLVIDRLQRATDQIAALIQQGPSAEVVTLPQRNRNAG
jgi:integrase